MASSYYGKSLKTPDLQTGEFSVSPNNLVRNLRVISGKVINIEEPCHFSLQRGILPS